MPNANIHVSTDTSTRRHFAEQWITAYPSDTEILILAHSAEAANDLQLRIASARGAWFGIKRFTLNGLAAFLAQQTLAEQNCAAASALSFVAIVARAVHALQSEGKLTYFEPVANRPGFPIAVARTLEELRMNAVEPQSLERLSRRGQDLAAIARMVEKELESARLADRATIFKTAIISAAKFSLPLLLLDLPLRSAREAELIQSLASNSPKVLATAAAGDERTIAKLEKALGCERTIADSSQTTNSLARVRQHLFQLSSLSDAKLDDSVQVASWPGEPRECIEIVRSIQAEAARGIPFDQMAVFLNSPNEYRSHLEEAFSRAEIPAYFAEGLTAPDPAGRALLALLSCAGDGLSASRFAEYLSLGQVPMTAVEAKTEWVPPRDELLGTVSRVEESKNGQRSLFEHLETKPLTESSVPAPWRWERLLVDSAVIGGKERWVRRLDGLKNELRLRLAELAGEEENRAKGIERQLQDLDHLRNFALPLIDQLDALPIHALWGEWLVHLRSLAAKALRQPDGVLATLAELEPMAPVGPVALYEVQLVLSSKLRELGVTPLKRRYGSVFVGTVDQSRGLSFSIVFVPGLAERIFPRKIVEDSILTDQQREDLDKGLLKRHDRLEQERLALRLAVGATEERLYLSYPRVDIQQARPRVPSFYALEALRAAEGPLPGFDELAARAESATRARLGWPAPADPMQAIDEAEYDLALLGHLVDADEEEVKGSAHYLLSANPHLARALRARSRRWLRRWTINDGLVDPDELAIGALARHQFSARPFSPTALQNYAFCPYKFFLSALMSLQPREEPVAIETLDPLTKGSLFHETQFRVLTKLKAENLLPVDASSLKQGLDYVDEAIERVAAEYADLLAPAIPRVWQDSINAIRADLREWLRRLAETDDGWIPHQFELAFGLGRQRSRSEDSVKNPVELEGGLKLRGSIDMVERNASGQYRVTDHKTGKARAKKDVVVGGGQHLQPLLYALASEKLLNGPVVSGRLYYCTADGGYEERIVELDHLNRQVVSSVIKTIRAALETGFLPAAPDKDACTWCDFRAACGPLEELRSGLKPNPRIEELIQIRKLP